MERPWIFYLWINFFFSGILLAFVAFGLAAVLAASLDLSSRTCDCYCSCNVSECNEGNCTSTKVKVPGTGTLNNDDICICNCNCEQNETLTLTPQNPLPIHQGQCEPCEHYDDLVYVYGDCTKFCKCQYLFYQHKNKIFNCPDSLYFDLEAKACLWPLQSNCPYKNNSVCLNWNKYWNMIIFEIYFLLLSKNLFVY